MTDARRAGVVVLLLLLAGAVVLAALPGLGAVRVAGVALAWWYGVVAAPLLAVLTTALVLMGADAPPPLAAWMSPALVGALLARVFAGEPSAPLLALLAVAAPLVALLLRLPVPRRDPVMTTLGAASAGVVLGGSLLVAGDVARLLGVTRWLALGLAGGLAATALLRRPRPRVRMFVLPFGMIALAAPLLAVPALGGPSPWGAWAGLAVRPALVFGEASAGATTGVRPLGPTTLAFSEPHRVTALSEGVYRVIARDGDRVAVHEWRLARGDALTLRPGDRLDLAAGLRVRFESGRRVPGAAPSGISWAEPRGVHPLGAAADVFAAALTLAGGAAVLLGRGAARDEGPPAGVARVAAILTPLAPFCIVVLAVCAGVYAAFAGPDLGLGAPAIAPLLGLPAVLPGPPWDRPLLAATLLGLAACLVATTAAFRGLAAARATAERAALRRSPVFWILAGTAIAVAAAGPDDPWRVLTLGCGLAASAVAAPVLAGAAGPARLAGSVIGAGAFIALALDVGELGTGVPVLAAYPALVAAPLAFGVARLGGRLAGDGDEARSVAGRERG